MVEVDPEAPARCAEHSQQCTRIDNIYTSSPPWMLLQWRAKVDIPTTPEVLFDKGISDYARLHLRLSTRAQGGVNAQPIPQRMVEHPFLSKYMGLLLNHADMDKTMHHSCVSRSPSV
eukprot:5215544-Pyramimonas_sp.AAC.1